MNSIRINEFIRFGIVGCIAVVVQYAVYYLCLKFVSHNVSYTIGYIFSFIVYYILTTSFTFRIKKTGTIACRWDFLIYLFTLVVVSK